MIGGAVALALMAAPPGSSGCVMKGFVDTFGQVPFQAETTEPRRQSLLLGPCLDEADCQVGDALGVRYDMLRGRVQAKVATVGSAISYPLGLNPADTLQTAAQTLSRYTGGQVEPDGDLITVPLCEDFTTRFEMRFVGGQLHSVGLYAQI